MQKPCLFGMNGFMVFLLTCFTVSARAQQSAGLILIDAENKQAFTVRMGDQMYSSSVHGHLVLSQLKDSAYRLCLRFPKNNLPEQVFPVKVRQKDLGFMLKGDDSSWVLYNWQTKETIHPVYVMDSSRILEMGVKRVDGFSKLMASVVNDSSVMYNTYTGNGFNPNDSLVIGHRVFVIGERPSAARHQPAIAGNPTPSIHPQPPVANNLQPAASSQKPTTDGQLPAPSESGANLKTQPSAFAATGTVKKADKDSLIVARKHQLHIEDSLQTLRKSLIKDSLRAVRAAKASSDSLLAVRKAFLRDSLRQAKKFTKDSLLAAKAGKDSLIAFNRRTQTA
jgi:hypothetical protein